MDSLVFDTSALLNFGHRGDLAALLRRLSGEYKLFTTTGARNELTDPKRKDYYAEFLRDHFTVQNPTTAPFNVATLARLARAIDPGEITVMTLAAEIKGIAILDEKAARREAKAISLRFTGTLGLLHQGLQRKWLTEAECLARVVSLCDAGFAIPRPLARQTLVAYISTLE
jgi:predicted nucleic acid-binding protein